MARRRAQRDHREGFLRSRPGGPLEAGRVRAPRRRAVALLADDQGANPAEYVLAALGGGLTTALVYNAAARGITGEEVESDLEGDLDLRGCFRLSQRVGKGYERIRVRVRVKSDAS